MKKNCSWKNTKIYTCSNASWKTEDGEMFELSSTATCSFRIWGNALLKWGKKGVGPFEVKKLLNGEDVVVRLLVTTQKKSILNILHLIEIMESVFYGILMWKLKISLIWYNKKMKNRK